MYDNEKDLMKKDLNILLKELERYGSTSKGRAKYKTRSCIFCSSSDALSINRKTNTYKCFSCGEYGDVLNLVEKKESVSFNQAIKMLALRNGIELSKKQYTEEEKKQFKEKKEAIQLKHKHIKNLKEEQNKAYAMKDTNLAYELEMKIDKVKTEELIVKKTEFEKKLSNALTYTKNGSAKIDQLYAGNVLSDEYDFINNEQFFYKYNPSIGVWEKFNKQRLRSLITRDLEYACNYWSDSVSRNLTNFLFDKTYGNIDCEVFHDLFNRNPYRIVFKNGTLDLLKNKFTEDYYKHDYNTVLIPHNYIEDAGVPVKTIEFLELMTDSIEEIDFIFEWIGYLFVKKYDITKMLFVIGDGGNGKSTLIKLMTAAVGANNTSAVSLKGLLNNRFQGSLLYNKLFNTVADIGSDFFNESDILKALTGDDTVTVERKGENGFAYMNFAKLTYSCNKLPKFKDSSGGLFRRPIVLPLDKDFTTLVKKKSLNINDIINDKEEMEKVVSYAVASFIRVIENDKNFTESKKMTEVKNRWLNDNSVMEFIEDNFEITGEVLDIIPFDDFYASYTFYCKDSGYMSLAKKNTVENIKANTELAKQNVSVKRINSKTKKMKVTGLKKV